MASKVPSLLIGEDRDCYLVRAVLVGQYVVTKLNFICRKEPGSFVVPRVPHSLESSCMKLPRARARESSTNDNSMLIPPKAIVKKFFDCLRLDEADVGEHELPSCCDTVPDLGGAMRLVTWASEKLHA